MAIIDRELMQSQLASGAKWDVAVAIKRGNPLPLDESSTFFSYEDAVNYAATSPVAYPTQIIAVVGADGVNSYYGITQTGGLEPIGGAVDVDDKSIMIEGEKLSLKNFGKQYYKWDADAHKHDDNPTTGFSSGLTPKVVLSSDGGFELAWYEPSTVTVDDVSTLVSSLQEDIKTIKATLYGDEASVGLVAKVDAMYSNEQIDQKIADAVGEIPQWVEL